MAATIGHPPGPETTRALLEQIAGGERGGQLRSVIKRWNKDATREQIEEAFQEACIRAERQCTGQTEGEVYVWLRTTTHHELKVIRERARHEIPVDGASAVFESSDCTSASPVELLIEREDREEISQLTLAVLDRLPERERDVAVLHSHGLDRAEIAGRLGVTPRMVKRSVEAVLSTGRDQLVRLVGFGCVEGHELVTRYAFGLAASREARRRAQVHLMTCPRCGAMYERLGMWRERVAALLPLPPAAEAHTHIAERVLHAGAEVVSSSDPGATNGVGGVRRHVGGALAHLREQASAAYYRTVDPTPLVGVRPGAVAAADAGCLAIGGGATYCVQQGADPFAVFTGDAPPQHHSDRPKRKPKRAHVAQAPAPPVVTQTVAATTTTQQQPAPQTTPTTTPAAPPPAPQDEFEPTSAGATSQTTARTASAKPKQPAPAPADGPGEFGGP